MSEVVKVCKIHGELTREQCNSSGKYLKCKKCKAAWKKSESGKLSTALTGKKYREKYPERAKNTVKNYRAKNTEAYQRYVKNKKRNARNKLADHYVRNRIAVDWKISAKLITPELVAIKKASLALKRRVWKRDGNS